MWEIRGCSYGGEVTWLGGLAYLSKVLPSSRNSYKNVMFSYEKWASPPRWDLTWFYRILPRWDENSPYEQAQVDQTGKVG